jgi:hypothetical protein
VDFDSESAGLIIRPEVSRGDKKPPQQRPCILGASEGFPHLAGQGTLGAVRDHFNRINKVLTLRAELGEAFAFGQLFERYFVRGCGPLGLAGLQVV